MTEDEARKTVCPMMSTPSTEDGIQCYSKGIPSINKIFCIASDCACWVSDKYEFNSEGMRMPVSNSGHCGLINR